jgi:hypothetical protein
MLTQGEDVEAHALKERGWSISAIARHLERDRKTVRSYLNGNRLPGVRVTVVVDPLADFEVYIRARFVDDPHLWATSLFDEVALGYARSYPSLVRQVRGAAPPSCFSGPSRTRAARQRRTATGLKTTVGVLGDTEPLLALPAAAFPATIEVTRVVAANATVAFRRNRYSVLGGGDDPRGSRAIRPAVQHPPHDCHAHGEPVDHPDRGTASGLR